MEGDQSHIPLPVYLLLVEFPHKEGGLSREEAYNMLAMNKTKLLWGGQLSFLIGTDHITGCQERQKIEGVKRPRRTAGTSHQSLLVDWLLAPHAMLKEIPH